MHTLRWLSALLAPPLCVGCLAGCGPDSLLCERCEAELGSSAPHPCRPPPGVDAVWAPAVHEGPARRLVAALKFRGLLGCADEMAARIAARAPSSLLDGKLVPVPPSASRLRARGHDPAAEIAAALARRSGLGVAACLSRAEGPRQVGRSRRVRIAAPPRIRATAPAPPRVLIVDDVMTTGATLAACAAALRGAGSAQVAAVTFARTPPSYGA